jgi:integrase
MKNLTMPSSFVFPGADGKELGSVRRPWDDVLAKAEIKDFRFHDLRHRLASKCVMKGVDLNTVRAARTQGLTMTLRYAHRAPGLTAAAVAKAGRVAKRYSALVRAEILSVSPSSSSPAKR